MAGAPAYEMLQNDPDWAPSLNLGHGEAKTASVVQIVRDLRKPNVSTEWLDSIDDGISPITVGVMWLSWDPLSRCLVVIR